MQLFVYDLDGDKYEIKSISYTQFNGKDTVIEYEVNGNSFTMSCEGWLTLDQIIMEFRESR